MSSEMEWFTRIEAEETKAAAQLSPYSRFSLSNLLVEDSQSHELFVNYEKETETLFRVFTRHFSQPLEMKIPNKVIAVVGPAGTGKTTFVVSFLQKLGRYAEALNCMKNVNFVMGFSGKMGDTRHLKDALPMKGQRGVVFFDDIHTAYYPTDSSNEQDLKKADLLRNLISQVNETFFISTWNVFGWKHALSVVPDLIKHFDQVIWLDGLDTKNMESMIRKRAKKKCINEEAFDFDKIFDSAGLKLAENAAMSNPRLAISLVHKAIIAAHNMNSDKVTEEIFKKVIEDLNVDINVDELIQDKITYYLLNSPSNTIKDLQKFVNMERSTIQKRLHDLVTKKIAISHEHKEAESIPKGKYYSLNQAVQVKMEKRICEEIKTNIHKYLYDKAGGMIKM